MAESSETSEETRVKTNEERDGLGTFEMTRLCRL